MTAIVVRNRNSIRIQFFGFGRIVGRFALTVCCESVCNAIDKAHSLSPIVYNIHKRFELCHSQFSFEIENLQQ